MAEIKNWDTGTLSRTTLILSHCFMVMGNMLQRLLPTLVKPLADGEADAVFGSRMIVAKDALSGGMPLYKFVGK